MHVPAWPSPRCDEKCKVEDAERRRVAEAARAATNPRSKRRHSKRFYL